MTLNKYKSIYVEDILRIERARIEEILYSTINDNEKVMMIRGIMELTDKLAQDEEEAE